ncbi:MAG: PspC domain-containing protein [Kutzneria sp.]|nr:PspC domain-containing protein [Kutzneria sp.]
MTGTRPRVTIPQVSAETVEDSNDAPAGERDRVPVRPLRRTRRRRVVAGVAGALSEHLDVDVLWVRIAFTVLAGLGGAGLLVYGLLWMFTELDSGDERSGTDENPKQRQQSLGLVALAFGLFAAFVALSGQSASWFMVPLAVGLGGVALVWREADEAQRRRWRDGARSGVTEVVGGGRGVTMRLVAGLVLTCGGAALLIYQSPTLDHVPTVLIAVLATLVGVVVLTVPWWLRLVRELDEQRRATVRTREREEIAAHLHDSVLQTLALIQKHAEDGREVVRLARGQERQLRTWLYGPTGYRRGGRPTGHAANTMLSEAIAVACGDVEDAFAVAVQHVVVGDCATDERLTALVQAAREAIVNSAKHSGVEQVSVYAEVEETAVTVFVRDRGSGFDADAVPEDRHGLADSINGRMRRNGGRVRLRTAPGEGTEVQLEMPRVAHRPQQDADAPAQRGETS